jgi:hypothetical protein
MFRLHSPATTDMLKSGDAMRAAPRESHLIERSRRAA